MKRSITRLLMATIAVAGLSLATHAQNNPFKIDDELYKYYRVLFLNNGSDKGLLMGDTLFAKAGKKKDVKAQCIALTMKCNNHYNQKKPDLLIRDLNTAKKFIINTPYHQYIFNCWIYLINHYRRTDQTDNAIQELEKMQKEALRLDNTYGICNSYRILGELYATENMDQKAMEAYRKAMEYGESHQYIQGEMSVLYRSMGNAFRTLDQLDSAAYYYKKALATSVNNERKTTIYINLGKLSVHDESPKGSKELASMKEYLDSLDAINTKAPIRTQNAFEVFRLKSYYYTFTADYEKALQYSDSLLPDTATWGLMKSYIYKQMKDYKSALQYQTAYITTAFAQLNKDRAAEVQRLSQSFDRQALENKNNLLKLENQRIQMENLKNDQQLLRIQWEKDTLTLKNTRLNLDNKELLLLKAQESAEKEKQRTEKEIQKAEYEKAKVRMSLTFMTVTFGILLLFMTFYIANRRRAVARIREEKDLAVRMEAEAEAQRETAEKARLHAEEADRLKSQFLQNMSHEIRTPLNAIVGFTGVLNSSEDMGIDPQEREEMMKMITTNTDQLLTLINDILDMSKLETNNYRLDLQLTDVDEVCTTVLRNVEGKPAPGVKLVFAPPAQDSAEARGTEALRTEAQATGAQVSEAQISGVHILETDRARLQQVLTNYLTNACKYTSQGSITLSYTADSECYRFSVADTGCGIPPEHAGKVFDRFEKLGSFKQGTGLGLNICKNIADLIGGEVYVDTTYSGGAKFVFVHPRKISAPTP